MSGANCVCLCLRVCLCVMILLLPCCPNRAQRSIAVSTEGEVFYMNSYSEIQRCIFCAYNG